MTRPCRPEWRNCALVADDEIEVIDRLADAIAPLPGDALRIRSLITDLELCHHKAERRVELILEAIGPGRTAKGWGTGERPRDHPVVTVWRTARATLSSWVAGLPAESARGRVGTLPASELLTPLGARTPLKEWQVQRVVDKVTSVIETRRPGAGSSSPYTWFAETGTDTACATSTAARMRGRVGSEHPPRPAALRWRFGSRSS